MEAIKVYYDESTCYIVTITGKTEIFKTKTGVKQGGPLSPKLYNIFIAELIEKITEKDFGIKLINIRINILLYPDDILLISNTRIEMIKMMETTND